MTAILYGQGARHTWSLSRDKEGHRTYKLKTKVETTSPDDGPATVMNTPGLPWIGSPWTFGNDSDFWAFCYPDMKVTMVSKGEPNYHWDVEQIFSTKPLNRCQDASIEDPLLEPQDVSGSFVTTQKAASKDRNGTLIAKSNFELVMGPEAEYDNSRPTVRVVQNVGSLGLATFSSMIDTVNTNALWGLAARKIKLSGITWSRRFWGLCNLYYTRTFEFEINYNTFDRSDIINRGTVALPGTWNRATTPPIWVDRGDPSNAANMVQAKDANENPIIARLTADGRMQTAIQAAAGPTYVTTVEYYPESNFLLLGIPVVF